MIQTDVKVLTRLEDKGGRGIIRACVRLPYDYMNDAMCAVGIYPAHSFFRDSSEDNKFAFLGENPRIIDEMFNKANELLNESFPNDATAYEVFEDDWHRDIRNYFRGWKIKLNICVYLILQKDILWQDKVQAIFRKSDAELVEKRRL